MTTFPQCKSISILWYMKWRMAMSMCSNCRLSGADQPRTIVLPLFESTEQSFIILWTRSISILKPLIAWRLDIESEKITKFFSFERRTTSIASRRAYSSALKMLAVFGIIRNKLSCLYRQNSHRVAKTSVQSLCRNFYLVKIISKLEECIILVWL